jgi:cytochrome c oxidase assembly protein Cox11
VGARRGRDDGGRGQAYNPGNAHEEGAMLKNRFVQVCLFAVVAVLLIGVAFAAAPKTYQVTGPVLSVSSDLIVVQKGKDKWELARNADTQVNGDLKVGAKVTIQYRMVATTVDVKPAK